MINTEPLNEIQRTTRASAALETLRQAILEARLAPGAPLLQAELARQLGISRAPLREALRELEEEGLVVNVPFRGAFVTTVDRRSLDELCGFRNLIERFAVERAIACASDAELERLRDLVDEMQRHADASDSDAVDAADIAFHTTICELADHQLLLQVWHTYAPQIQRAMAQRNKVGRNPQRIVAMHRPIVEAILRRDTVAAVACFAEHGTDLVSTLFGDEAEAAPEGTDPARS